MPRPPALESAPGYKRLSENTLGELGYRALLGQFISDDEAKSAGSRWLADRYILYERSRPAAYAIVARSRWSSPEAALQIFREDVFETVLWDPADRVAHLVGARDAVEHVLDPGAVDLVERDVHER